MDSGQIEDIAAEASDSTSSAKRPAPDTKFEAERKNFRQLIIGNPNYFGNLKTSPFKPIKSIISNTTYEELKCVGFNPQLSKLEAVVWVKQAGGYGGDVCTLGTPEYVRFWLSYDNGATWLDQGLESFTAYDIPVDHPLEYAVSRSIDPTKLFCFTENLPLVRAILSWNDPPTDPFTPPVWGNIVDARIQIEPWFWIFFPDLIKEAKLKIDPKVAALIDSKEPLKLKPPKALSVAELKAAYAHKSVPDHRLLHGALLEYIAHPELTAQLKEPGSKGLLADLGIDWAKVIEALLATDGDTNFEELTCVGFDPNGTTPDALVGILQIKRPSGYLGDLCEAGSNEYVGFWVDWGDGIWHWAGTAQVNVHDINGIPPGGLSYAVYQPVNFDARRKPCTEGPVIARVRAILSWNTPPTNPDYVPSWGNRIETHIHLYPGTATAVGDYTPYIQSLCDTAICNIDRTTGFAPGERPFGGTILIRGQIPGAPNVLTPAANRPQYKITVQQLPGGSPQALNDTFYVTVDEQIGSSLPTSTSNVPQSVGAGDYYTYLEAPPVPGVGWRTVTPARLLGVWNTAGKTGRWLIQIEARDPVTSAHYAAGQIVCLPSGAHISDVIVDLDEAAPVTSLHITGYQAGGVGPVLTDILDCGTFHVGDVLHGSYSVSDEHFGSLSLTGEPIAGGGPGLFTIDGIATNSRSYPSIPTTGQSGTWTFNTAGLEPCGYTIQLSTSDRTIVSCGGGWENNSQFVGFCLVAAAS